MAQAAPQRLLAFTQGFRALSNARKLGLMVAMAAAVALVAALLLWGRAADYRVLFSNLSERDGGSILAALSQMNVPYQTPSPGTILVPANQVYETRLRLASQGLPKGGSVGFELLENQRLGITQFTEQVNFQRALQGELERTIGSLAAVQSARVHIAIPRPSVFARDNQKPSASVLVALHPGRVLDAAQITGIVHLVASSVPEMPTRNVAVIDQNGNLLANPTQEAATGVLDPAQLSYVRRVEDGYAKRIEAIVGTITGPENVRAQVTASLDFSEDEQTAETFRPNPGPDEAAIRSQQTIESSGGGTGASGVPGTLSNTPPGAASAPINPPPAAAPAAAPAPATSRESRVNYELDKTIRHTRTAAGAVKRLSAAVVVNYRRVTADGKTSLQPLTAQEIAQVNSLVREAIGFNADRGDTVNVVNASFTGIEREALPALPFWKDPANIAFAKEIGRDVFIGAVVFYVLFGLLRPAIRNLSRRAEGSAAAIPPPAESADAYTPGAAAGTTLSPAARQEAEFESNRTAVRDFAKQNPAAVANVIKDWVSPRE